MDDWVMAPSFDAEIVYLPKKYIGTCDWCEIYLEVQRI